MAASDYRDWSCSAPASAPPSSMPACFWRACGLSTVRRPFRKYRVLGRVWRIDWPLTRQLIAIGAPILIEFACWSTACSAPLGLLMGLIGNTALAAHQVALQIAAILFMVPLGIGIAATVRVGHAVGRNDAPAVRRAGFVATVLGIVFMSVMTLAVILGRFAIGRFFFGEAADSAGAVIDLTATSCCWSARPSSSPMASRPSWPVRFRGLNDTRVPLFAEISYWLVGFPAACGLGVPDGAWQRSAYGSACPAAPRSMRGFSFCASDCSRTACRWQRSSARIRCTERKP